MEKKLSNENDNRVRVLKNAGILLVLVPLLIGAASAATWYVDDDGGAGINFTQIQEAVDAAQDNDTIIVYHGTYNESITMHKRLILKGEGHPVVGGITISTDGCVIDGFNVTGSTDSGIYVYSDYNLIVNNSVYDNEDDGIELEGSDYNTLKNNLVFNNSDDGIDLDDSEYNTIANNSVFNISENGMDIEHSFNNTVINNTVCLNAESGIKLKNSSTNSIRNNIIHTNGGAGIYLCRSWGAEPVDGGSSYNTITSNVIYSNDCAGIELKENSSNNHIYNNNLIYNGETACDEGNNNSWDNGPIIGGNYWGDHKCTGNPSNGSQPYYIGRAGVDRYPFEDPIGEFELPQLPTTISIDSSQDYMERQYISSGSFSSEPTDMTYRMTLVIDARWGQFNVPRIVIYNSTPLNLEKAFYTVDDVYKGTGEINVFSDHIEWYGSNESVFSEFVLGIHALNTHNMTPPFSSCRTIGKEVFNGNDTVNITVSVTPAQALDDVAIWSFAEETDDASSELLVDTASNSDFIAFADHTGIRWSFEGVIAGETYSTSVQAKVIPKTDSTFRYWLYTKVGAGYGEYADISSGSNQSCIQYIDPHLGTVQIYFDEPVDYTLRTNGEGTFFERYYDYSEDVEDGEPHNVRLWSNAYKPGVRTVPVGTTVRWTNTEQLVHTVTSDAGLWDSGTLEEGQHFSYTFNTQGTYTYHDALHPSMRGTVIVQQPSLL